MNQKLTLQRETVRQLTETALSQAAGGSTSDNPFSNSCHSGEDGSCNGGCWWRYPTYRTVVE